MTTPTPNERDKHWAGEAADLASQEPEKGWEPMFAHLFASYRQEIEAEKDKRISTLEAALEKAEKALEDLLHHGATVPNHQTGEPEQYQSNPELALEALAAIAEALHPTSPQPTSGDSTAPAAAD